MSTAKFLENSGYIIPTDKKEGGWNVPFVGTIHGSVTMAREKRLESNEINCMYVAAYLRYFIDTWKSSYPEIAKKPGILGTLYNIGHQKHKPHKSPSENNFGKYARENYNHMGDLLGIK